MVSLDRLGSLLAPSNHNIYIGIQGGEQWGDSESGRLIEGEIERERERDRKWDIWREGD